MKLKHIFRNTYTKIFVVTNQENDNALNWIIEPTDLELIPEEENTYFTKAKQVFSDRTMDCFIGIIIPERIAETVIKRSANGQLSAEHIYDQQETTIPGIASNCTGAYELYYAKENPQIGIDILKDGLTKATNRSVVAEDLGYILRDEDRTEEAIQAFQISEREAPSSEYIYLELSRLYKELGQTDNELRYKQKFLDNGGIDMQSELPRT